MINIVVCYLYRFLYSSLWLWSLSLSIYMIIVVVSFLRHVLIFSWHFFHLSFLPEMLFRQTLVFAMMSFSLELQKSTHATSLQASGSRFPEVLGPVSMLLLQSRWVLPTGPCSAGYRWILPSKMPSMRAPNHGHWAFGVKEVGEPWSLIATFFSLT